MGFNQHGLPIRPLSAWSASEGRHSARLLEDHDLRGITSVGIIVLDGPINRGAFEVYVEKVLVPDLRLGAIVVMDNMSSHKGPPVREMIEAAGASLLYLPPYSPDFNPIENAFAKFKAFLRKAAERTVDGLWSAMGGSIGRFTPI